MGKSRVNINLWKHDLIKFGGKVHSMTYYIYEAYIEKLHYEAYLKQLD